MQPEYISRQGNLVSKRAEKVQAILKLRYPNNILMCSSNCMEGMEMFNAVKSILKDEKNSD